MFVVPQCLFSNLIPSQLIDKCVELQAHLQKQKPSIKDLLIEPATFHLTLLVMHLDEEQCLHVLVSSLAIVMVM